MRVVAYYRYSTDNAAQKENSELRQKVQVESLIHRNRWTLVDTFSDKGKSGKSDKPELERLKKLYADGQIDFDCICIYDLSRITRRSQWHVYKDLGWLSEAGKYISEFRKNNGEPRLVSELETDLAAIVDVHQNNEYIRKLQDNIITGYQTKFPKGEIGWMGPTPIGFDPVNKERKDIKTTIANNEDAKVVREIFDHFLSGGSRNSAVKILAKARRFVENTSKTPNRTSVINILRNSIYCGIRTFGVRATGDKSLARHGLKYVKHNPLEQAEMAIEYVADGFTPIVSLEEYKKVQHMLDNSATKVRSWPARSKHKYSSLFRCGSCGTPLNAAVWKSGGKRNVTYVCPRSTDAGTKCKDGDAPKRKYIREDEVSELLSNAIAVRLFQPEIYINTAKEMLAKMKMHNVPVEDELEYKKQKAKFDELFELFSADETGYISERLKEQSQILSTLEKKIAKAKAKDAWLDFAEEQYAKQAENGVPSVIGKCYELAAMAYAAESDEEKKSALEAIEHLPWYSEQRDDGVLVWRNLIADDVEYSSPASKRVQGVEDEASRWEQRMRMSCDPDKLLELAVGLGMTHILVDFELGKFRGRARRIPTQLRPVFAIAGNDSTDKLVVITSNRFQLVR